MTDRQIIALGIVLLMIAAFVGVAVWKWYHQFDRKYARQRRRDQQRYLEVMARKQEEDPD